MKKSLLRRIVPSSINCHIAINSRLALAIFVVLLQPLVVANIGAAEDPHTGVFLRQLTFGDSADICEHVECLNDGRCLSCKFPSGCRFNETVTVSCKTNSRCHDRQFPKRRVKCRFCWQIEDENDIECLEVRNCSTNDIHLHPTVCRVKPHVICMGQREFPKNVKCYWTSGCSWFHTLFLSIFLGGFGVDRFYLGLWKSAIAKLFSFGGLGIWTLIDIVLVLIGYLQPADESLYIF